MKDIIIDMQDGTVNLNKLRINEPVFACERGKLVGMVVKEDEGWILRLGGPFSSNGHHESRRECIESNIALAGYTFHA